MNKNKGEKIADYESSDVDDDVIDENYEHDLDVNTCEMKEKNKNKIGKNNDYDSDDYYGQEILNHRKSKEKTVDVQSGDSDIENDDKLSYIVQAVLEELKSEKSEAKNKKKKWWMKQQLNLQEILTNIY